jgi:hypothetical protein
VLVEFALEESGLFGDEGAFTERGARGSLHEAEEVTAVAMDCDQERVIGVMVEPNALVRRARIGRVGAVKGASGVENGLLR